jgi:AbrB family looped-hinge helix DNA binding protein
MREIVATITSKGQITIPKEVRTQLGVTPNDKVAFLIDDDGTVTLQHPQFPTIASLAGFAGKLPRPMTWEHMREIAREDRQIAKASEEQ